MGYIDCNYAPLYTYGTMNKDNYLLLSMADAGVFLGSQAWKVHEGDEGIMVTIFDPVFQIDESQLMEIKRCIEIGLLCTQYDRIDRPTMPNVLRVLNGEDNVSTPKKLT